ncbi:MAG TPA: PIN domain-containing protein [Planctomycetota bacterium]|nr:PIN domain-containing protein [Planctomycetota bacterium]
MIQLDTSFLIRALIQGTREDRALRRWLEEGEEIAMSSIAWTEFLCGPVDAAAAAAVDGLLTERLPYTEDDAARAAELFNASGRRRGSLVDCIIAAVALRSAAPLATSNRADFRPFEDAGLTLLP